MSNDRIEKLEETAAHLSKLVDDLNEVVTRQDSEIAKLTTQVTMLMRREAAREAESPGSVMIGDERPPHY
ncbi:SlyX protein [Poseidonocella pacifica]|uniref:SlyX protein n=1 Tax=Poseidonocella pacifica TaxID=871651 RepID=A0A1I0W9A5_9RHOB|nr:SlyX family protein [Poseidonocella pacifica]SFA84917.1 SlyX protein [Poseidonocella pacifica]